MYKCSGCDYKSDTKSSVLSHLDRKKKCSENPHLEIDNSIALKCNICNASFANSYNLNRHILSCEKKVDVNLDLVYKLMIEQHKELINRLDEFEKRLTKLETGQLKSKKEEPVKVIPSHFKKVENPQICGGVVERNCFCPESHSMLMENISRYYENPESLEKFDVSFVTKKSTKYSASQNSKSIDVEMDGEEQRYYFNPTKRGDEVQKSVKGLFVHLKKLCDSPDAHYMNPNTMEYYCLKCALDYDEEE